MSQVLFMVYKEFYDQIESGEKRTEYRGYSKWRWLLRKRPERAVLMCGPRRLTVEITGFDLIGWDQAPHTAQVIYPDESKIIAIHLGLIV